MPSAHVNGRTGSCLRAPRSPRGPRGSTRALVACRKGLGHRRPSAPTRTSGAGRPRGHRWALRRGARGGNATLPPVPSAARWRLWPSRHPQPRTRGRRGPACPSIRGGPARVAARSPFSLLVPRRQKAGKRCSGPVPEPARLSCCDQPPAAGDTRLKKRAGSLFRLLDPGADPGGGGGGTGSDVAAPPGGTSRYQHSLPSKADRALYDTGLTSSAEIVPGASRRLMTGNVYLLGKDSEVFYN